MTLEDFRASGPDSIRRGPFGSTVKKEFFVPFGYKVYEQQNAIYDDSERGDYFITEEKFRALQSFEVKPNDLIISCSGTVGRIAIIPEWAQPGIINQALLKLSLDQSLVLNSYFVPLFRHKVREIMAENARGSAMQNITGVKGLKKVLFPVAPLDDQHRIVAEIEKQFTRLDAGVDSLKRVQAGLKRYRASVLKAACEGRLVATEAKVARGEERDYEDARSLLQSVLRERLDKSSRIRKEKGLLTFEGNLPAAVPEGWHVCSIDEVAACLDFKRVPINKAERTRRPGAIPYYGANGQVGWIDDYIFNETLVLVVEDETFTGRTQEFSYLIHGKSWVNNHAHVLRATRAADPRFLNYSLAYYPFTPRTTGSTGRRKLTQRGLMTAPFLLPPLVEQRRIVEEVERRLSVIEELEATAVASLKRAERLRQSILHRAFTGKLLDADGG
jgi:type I restriction enzyme S subunit